MSSSLVARVAAAALLWPAAPAAAAEDPIVIDDMEFSHKWSTMASMSGKRSDMSATTVGDAIYLVGGCTMDQTWVESDYPGYVCGGGASDAVTTLATKYLPASDKHESLPPSPRPRYRHGAAAVGGKLYLFGGSDAAGGIVSKVDVFDTASKSWSTLATDMPHATTDLAAFAFDGKIYLVGGYTADWVAETKTQIFDPTAQGAAAWAEGPAMLEGRGDHGAVVLGGKAHAFGGFTHVDSFQAPLGSMEVLDLEAAELSWVAHRDMHVARGDKASAALHGVLHVVGGESKSAQGHSVPLKDVEVFHPGKGGWYLGGSIPTDRFRFTAAAHGDSLYIFGGQGYLVGEFGKPLSYYPVLDTVESYLEKVTRMPISAAHTVKTWLWAALVASAIARCC